MGPLKRKGKKKRAPLPMAAPAGEEEDTGDLQNVRGSSSSGRATADQRTWSCDICPRSFLAAQVINIGSRRYPKHRCKPCHNAARALERASKSQTAAAQEPPTPSTLVLVKR